GFHVVRVGDGGPAQPDELLFGSPGDLLVHGVDFHQSLSRVLGKSVMRNGNADGACSNRISKVSFSLFSSCLARACWACSKAACRSIRTFNASRRRGL